MATVDGRPSDDDTLDLVDGHAVCRPVVELRRLRRGRPAICCACSRVRPFDKYAVIPIAWNVWRHVEGAGPRNPSRRLIIARTSCHSSAGRVSRRPGTSIAVEERHYSVPRTHPPGHTRRAPLRLGDAPGRGAAPSFSWNVNHPVGSRGSDRNWTPVEHKMWGWPPASSSRQRERWILAALRNRTFFSYVQVQACHRRNRRTASAALRLYR